MSNEIRETLVGKAESVGWQGFCMGATVLEIAESALELRRNLRLCRGMAVDEYAKMRYRQKLETCRSLYDQFGGPLGLEGAGIPVAEMLYWRVICGVATSCGKKDRQINEERFREVLEKRWPRAVMAMRSLGGTELFLSEEARDALIERVMTNFEEASGQNIVRIEKD